VATLTIAGPDQFENGVPVARQVKAFVRGEMQMVDAKDVDVVMPTARQAFSISSNTIPFLASAGGNRAQMATKMMEQAIPLVEREAPLVQIKLGGKTVESAVGSGFAVDALEDGVVKSIGKHRIVIATKDGEVEQPIYSNLPLNNKAFIDASPRVKVGDVVKKGDVIADSNFTSNGVLAIGTNLRAAYVPWKGYNFEDGIVITDEAAKKLTSEHLHQFEAEQDATTELGLKQFMAWKQGGIDNDQRALLDDDGVVKKGTILRKGDPLWVGVRENKLDSCYVRPIAFYGSEKMGVSPKGASVHVAIAAWPWGAYLGPEGLEKGIRVKTSSFARHHVNVTMARAKFAATYANSILANLEATADGYDEAMLLDVDGFVAEGSGENVFIVKNGKLYEPELTSALIGITRDAVIQLAGELGIPVVAKRLTRDDVYIADEAFFTGTAAEVTPIRELDNRRIGSGARGPITQKIQSLYFDCVHGRVPRRLEWLTPV
jgi:branched-chain amino acid aminotransferase